jgi:glyoxylase-like metal-dependent hydrolase (beta-lactamase superfamily II)
MRIFDGVYMIQGEVGGRPLQLMLLVGEKSLLMDTGCPPDPRNIILPYFRKIGLNPCALTYIVNTHCDFDHTCGNWGMKQACPQALLGCGKLDQSLCESPFELFSKRYDAYKKDHGIHYSGEVKKWIREQCGRHPQPMDVCWVGGEKLRLSKDWEVELLHVPGHSRGHLAVLDRRHRALYSGDAIHGRELRGLDGTIKLCPTYLWVDEYLQTIQRIENLDVDTLIGCHWPIKRGDEIRAFCGESRNYCLSAEEHLLRALRAGKRGLTLRQLCEQCGPKLGEWPRSGDIELVYTFNGHVLRLEAMGLIRVDRSKCPLRYRAV